MADLEGKLRELADRMGLSEDEYGGPPQDARGYLVFLSEAAALGRAEGFGDSLKIVREFTYLDGQAGDLANLLVKRIEAIRALKEKV